MANHEYYYRIECEIRDFGEPGRLEKRENDPMSFFHADVSMEGEGAFECLINLLKGILNGDPRIAESKATVKYLENAIKENMKKERTTKEAELIASARKTGYSRRPSILIKVYRMG